MPKNHIREVRLKKNVEKRDLARAIRSTTSRVSAIENGTIATIEELAQFAIALNSPLDELYPNQEQEWPEIERKRQYIKIQQDIDLREAQQQADEHKKLQTDIEKRRAEKQKLSNHLKKIKADHETKLREHEELEDLLTKNRILRELNFPPEFHSAGITILQGFVKLIKNKYGDTKVGVTIKQVGSKVILIITAPDGKVEEIEEYLDRYTEVVSGSREIATLTDDPIAILELKGQLEIARSQYQQQRDINLLLKNTHEQRIQCLESQLDWFKNHLALSMESSRHVLENVLSRLETQDQRTAQLAGKLVELVVAQQTTSTKLLSLEKSAPTNEGHTTETKPKEVEKTINELNKIVVKEGVGKGLADAIKKLIAWATTHFIV